MQRNKNVIIENTLSYQMLEKAANSDEIKDLLFNISQQLLSNTLTPLRHELGRVKQFSDLAKHYQALLVDLSSQLTAQGRQYGALLPGTKSSADIVNSMENIFLFLGEIEKKLLQVKEIRSVDEIAIFIKTIIELTCLYYEAPNEWHTSKFNDIKTYLAPTTEEIDIRLTRVQLGEPAKFAITYGISTNQDDFALQTDGIGRITGKSIFGTISMEHFLTLLCADYDNTQSEKSASKMDYYKIPRDITLREPISSYAKKWKLQFEKLCLDPDTQLSQPLIASVSRSTARTLVTLQDLGAFNTEDGVFNFDKAQIFANCLMGFIIHGSHHSTSEVAEVYNRLLDYIAINNLENHGPIPIKSENDMPYYRYNNYASFFSKKYAEELVESANILQMKNI